MLRALFALVIALLVWIVPASAADRYWVGGTGNWSDNTNHWSASSGGAPGASLPTSADNCIFDSASNATAYTVTMDVAGSCLDITTALPSGSGVPTISGSGGGVQVYGSLNFVAGTVFNPSGGLAFLSTVTGRTITTNGGTLGALTSVTFNGSGGGWTLQDNLTLVSNRTITVTNGTLDTNGQTVTAGFFVSTSGTRTLTFTNSTFNITGTSGTPWNVSSAGSLTATLTGSTINFNGGAAFTLLTLSTGSSVIYDSINITGPGNWIANNTLTVKNLYYTSTTNKTDSLNFAGNVTIQASGALAIAGNSTVNRAFVFANVLGSAATIIVPNTATVSLTNVDFRDINAAGTYGTWTGTSLGDCLGNSGITFDAGTTQTFTGTGVGKSWSDVTAWTSRVPLPQDDVILAASSAGSALSSEMPRLGRNIDGSAYNRGWSFTSIPNTLFGNLTLGASSTISGTQPLTLAGRGSHTITSNGKTFTQSVAIAAFGGTYTQQDAFATAGAFSLTNGTWADGGFGGTSLTFVSSNSNVRGVNITGPWVVTSSTSGATIWNFSTTINLTVTALPSLVQVTGNPLIAQTIIFTGGGFTFNNFWWSGTTALGTLAVQSNNTFRDFKIDGTTARTVTFAASTVTTVNTFTKSNTTQGVRTTINSSTGGTRATLLSRGPKQSLENLNITDINALGGAGWFAGNNSVNGGNNYGWRFYPPGDIMTIMKQRRSSNDNLVPTTKAA